MSNDIIKLKEASDALQSVYIHSQTNIVHCVLSSLRNRFELLWGQFNCACYSLKWSGRGGVGDHIDDMLCDEPHGLSYFVGTPCRSTCVHGAGNTYFRRIIWCLFAPNPHCTTGATARVYTVAYTTRINTRRTHYIRARAQASTISIMYKRALLANMFVRADHDSHFRCPNVPQVRGANNTRGRRHHSRTLTYNSIILPFIYTCTAHGW